jgi:hypothetical protein
MAAQGGSKAPRSSRGGEDDFSLFAKNTAAPF